MDPAELIVSPPASSSPAPSARVKSPPLAFAPTSNDSLAPLRLPDSQHDSPSGSRTSMGQFSPQSSGQDLQVIIDQQANALQLLHEAFAAERQAWNLDRERLYQRIGSLEQLLKTRDHHSPAKSPILSPVNGSSSSITSPSGRAMSNSLRLPSIAEDENIQPLSQRRDGAPMSIDLPGRPPIPLITREGEDKSERAASVSFDGDIKVEEIPISPPSTAKRLSPPPPNNRVLAGHTSLKAPRPPTPPPHNMSLDGLEDTPTRHNTHINSYLTQSRDSEEDVALTGPLNMPELPNKPDETNFTLEALSKRLEQIEQHPEEARPMVFAEPSPGLASPADPMDKANPLTATKKATEAPLAPQSTISHSSDIPSSALSPSAAVSPNGAPLSQQQSHEMQIHHDFEHGGIKLKKKASVNFGAPFGQLGGFGGSRKLS